MNVSNDSCRDDTWLEFHSTVTVAFAPTVVFRLINSVAASTSKSNSFTNKFPFKKSSAFCESFSFPNSSLAVVKKV